MLLEIGQFLPPIVFPILRDLIDQQSIFMKRRNFLAATLAAPAAAASGTSLHAESATIDGTITAFVVKAGEARSGIHTPFKGINVNDVKISGKDTAGQLAVFEYIGKEKTGPALHVHHHQDEIFSIVEGEYLFQVGEEKFKVKAGDTVFAPRGIPHTWIQLTDFGKQIYSVQPAGKLEEMFLKLNEFKAPPTEAELRDIHQQAGLDVLGPALALK
jgi:quercetin dioxygenase-like cupin family protein